MTCQISVAAAVNDRQILADCLERSPDIAEGRLGLRIFEGYRTAGLAYNAAIDACDAPYVLLVHQDVYLPAGTLQRLTLILAELDTLDTDWVVAGVVGRDLHRVVMGETWSSGLGKMVGKPLATPVQATALDEMLLLYRKASGIRFDEDLPSFHLFGTDIVQSALATKQSSWIVHLPVVHNSRPVRGLAGGYRDAYRYMQRKWRHQLPLWTLVLPITRGPLRLIVRDLKMRFRNRGRIDRPTSKLDPCEIARALGFEAQARL